MDWDIKTKHVFDIVCQGCDGQVMQAVRDWAFAGECRDGSGNTVLHRMAQSQTLTALSFRAVIYSGADIEAVNNAGDRPWHVFCRHVDTWDKRVEHICRTFLDAGVNTNALNAAGKNGVACLVAPRVRAIVQNLIDNRNFPVSGAGRQVFSVPMAEQTAWLFEDACAAQDDNAIRQMLCRVKDVNACTQRGGNTFLHLILQHCPVVNAETVQCAIDNGANVRLESAGGLTPWHLFCIRLQKWDENALKTAVALLNAGAEPELRGRFMGALRLFNTQYLADKNIRNHLFETIMAARDPVCVLQAKQMRPHLGAKSNERAD